MSESASPAEGATSPPSSTLGEHSQGQIISITEDEVVNDAAAAENVGSVIPRWASLTGGAIFDVSKKVTTGSVKLGGSALQGVKQRVREQLEARQQAQDAAAAAAARALGAEEVALLVDRSAGSLAGLGADRVAAVRALGKAAARLRRCPPGEGEEGEQGGGGGGGGAAAAVVRAVVEQAHDLPAGDAAGALAVCCAKALRALLAPPAAGEEAADAEDAAAGPGDRRAVAAHLRAVLGGGGAEALVPLLDPRLGGAARRAAARALRVLVVAAADAEARGEEGEGEGPAALVEAAVLDTPAGMQLLADLALGVVPPAAGRGGGGGDAAAAAAAVGLDEAARNEALLLLAALTARARRPDLQNFLAFHDGFDHLFRVARAEKTQYGQTVLKQRTLSVRRSKHPQRLVGLCFNPGGTVVSLDALQAAGAALRGNALPQKLFLAAGGAAHLADLLTLRGEDLVRPPGAGRTGEGNGEEGGGAAAAATATAAATVAPLRRAQVLLCLEALAFLLALPAGDGDWADDLAGGGGGGGGGAPPPSGGAAAALLGLGSPAAYAERQGALGATPGLLPALARLGTAGEGVPASAWAGRGVGAAERTRALVVLTALVWQHPANQALLASQRLAGPALALEGVVAMASLPAVGPRERSAAEGLWWAFLDGNAVWCDRTLGRAAGAAAVPGGAGVAAGVRPPRGGAAAAAAPAPALGGQGGGAGPGPVPRPAASSTPAEEEAQTGAAATVDDLGETASQQGRSAWDLLDEGKSAKKKGKHAGSSPPASSSGVAQQVPPSLVQGSAIADEATPPEQEGGEADANSTGMIGAVGKGLWGGLKWAAKAVDAAVSAEYEKVQAEEQLAKVQKELDQSHSGSAADSQPPSSPLKTAGSAHNLRANAAGEVPPVARSPSASVLKAQKEAEALAAQHAELVQALFAGALFDPPSGGGGGGGGTPAQQQQLAALRLLRALLRCAGPAARAAAGTGVRVPTLLCPGVEAPGAPHRPPTVPAASVAVALLLFFLRRAAAVGGGGGGRAPEFHLYVGGLAGLLCVWVWDCPELAVHLLRQGQSWALIDAVAPLLTTSHKDAAFEYSDEMRYMNALAICFMGVLMDGVRQQGEGAASGRQPWLCTACGNNNLSHQVVCSIEACKSPRRPDEVSDVQGTPGDSHEVQVTEQMFVSAMQERFELVMLCDGLASSEVFCKQQLAREGTSEAKASAHLFFAAACQVKSRLIELIAHPSLLQQGLSASLRDGGNDSGGQSKGLIELEDMNTKLRQELEKAKSVIREQEVVLSALRAQVGSKSASAPAFLPPAVESISSEMQLASQEEEWPAARQKNTTKGSTQDMIIRRVEGTGETAAQEQEQPALPGKVSQAEASNNKIESPDEQINSAFVSEDGSF